MKSLYVGGIMAVIVVIVIIIVLSVRKKDTGGGGGDESRKSSFYSCQKGKCSKDSSCPVPESYMEPYNTYQCGEDSKCNNDCSCDNCKAGQVCDAEGNCVCDTCSSDCPSGRCPSGQKCQGGVCVNQSATTLYSCKAGRCVMDSSCTRAGSNLGRENSSEQFTSASSCLSPEECLKTCSNTVKFVPGSKWVAYNGSISESQQNANFYFTLYANGVVQVQSDNTISLPCNGDLFPYLDLTNGVWTDGMDQVIPMPGWIVPSSSYSLPIPTATTDANSSKVRATFPLTIWENAIYTVLGGIASATPHISPPYGSSSSSCCPDAYLFILSNRGNGVFNASGGTTYTIPKFVTHYSIN